MDIVLGGNSFWGEIGSITKQINKNNCNTWRTDNSGKISKTNNTNIGVRTYSNKCEKGNGEKLAKKFGRYNFNATNIMYNPKNNDKGELIAWASGCGNVKKQLDYITISNKRKNWVKYVKTKGIDNTNQHYQHKILQMDIRT